jgi:hypothetical protein
VYGSSPAAVISLTCGSPGGSDAPSGRYSGSAMVFIPVVCAEAKEGGAASIMPE